MRSPDNKNVGIHCFYCDRPLTSDTAYLTPAGKTSCLDDYREFHGGEPEPTAPR